MDSSTPTASPATEFALPPAAARAGALRGWHDAGTERAWWTAAAPWRWPTLPSDHDFMALNDAYRRLGGLARTHELARAWTDDGPAGAGRLESLVDSGQVFAFHWHDSLWLPRFQLDRGAHDVAGPVRQVLDEFGAGLDGWELACWFVEPHAWLDDQAPAERLGDALPRVLAAARADRFVRQG